ncbi:MAG: N-acetylmuramoyl-L-alanine amidase, partial [Candidatus Marinimicrobia bacterium]|nr:N-acetylmuramoyl-L-alanine amidase [Candidatus Neomarinimicrobiota bacterium]
AKRHQSDLLVSIHHNGSGNDPDIDLPIVYFFGPASKNPASVDFGHILLAEMRKQMVFEQPSAGAVYSDHLIYSSGTSILRNTIELMPGVIGEGGFFTNPAGERRLRSRAYNKLEAEVYFQAILTYFDRGLPTATPVIPDSLKYLDLNDRVQFQLDDGFGSHFFDGTSFEIFQNGEPLKAAWDEMLGILSAAPVPTQEQQVSFQVFGRNFKGNSIHPVAFNFLTETGDLWYSVDSWRTAFQRADSLLLAYNSVDSSDVPEKARLLDETLHHYQLSLELQIVHPKARIAEVRILDLLEQKQKLLKLDLAEQLNIQRQILLEYYPQ